MLTPENISGEHILNIAKYHVYKKAYAGLDVDDAIQDVVEALLKCMRSYDPDKGASFKYYIHRRARGAVLDSMRKQGTEYTVKLMTDKETGTVARKFAYRVCEYDTIEYTDSLQDYNDIEKTKMWAKYATTDRKNIEEWELLRSCIHILSVKEKTILFYYYWLNYSMSEIGKFFEVTEGRISQIIERSLRKCRNYLENIETIDLALDS